MGIFGQKSLNPQDYETFLKRLVDLEQRIRNIELAEEDLRNKVLRKIQKRDTQQLPTTAGSPVRR